MFFGKSPFPIRISPLLLLVFIFALSAPVLLAQQKPERVLELAEKALGKKKAVSRVRSWKKRGLLIRSSDGASGEIVMQAAKPDNFNVFYEIRGFENEIGYNGKSGWIRDSREGLKTLTGDASRDLKAEALFRNWGWTEYKKQKLTITDSGSLSLDGMPSISITLTNPLGVPLTLYFDAFNYHLLREEIRAGDTLYSYDYSDYRSVNGVLEAFEVTAYMDNQRYVFKFDQVVHNPKIADAEFDFPKTGGEPLPDIASLLKEIRRNQEEVERILEDYTYKQDIVKRDLTDEGEMKVKESETYQITFLKGYRIQRLIARDGKPLSPEDQKDADEKAQESVKDIEKKLAKAAERSDDQIADTEGGRDGSQISISEMLKASRLLNPRRERFRGRNAIVFDFEPDPDFDFDNAQKALKLYGRAAGVMWIDEQDKQVVRVEAVLSDSLKVGGGILAKLRKGASFTLEQEKINDEVWLPTFGDINFSVRVLLFGGVKVNQLVRSYEFKKFRTDVEDARINEIPDQQN